MKKILFVLIAALTAAASSSAQTLGEPFWLLRIVQTESGPGVDTGPVEAYRTAKSGVDIIGIRSVTGPSQLWLMEAHASFASIEALDQALAQVAPNRPSDITPVRDWLLARSTTLLGLYRPGLSYRPEDAIKLLPSARYFRVTVFRIRPGTDIEFSELMRLRRFGLESVNLDRPEIGYQIISGSTSGTYVFVSPVASLASMDSGIARLPAYAEDAMQGSTKTARQTGYDALLSRESLLFRVEPSASYVSAEFAGSDAAFWHPEPAPR